MLTQLQRKKKAMKHNTSKQNEPIRAANPLYSETWVDFDIETQILKSNGFLQLTMSSYLSEKISREDLEVLRLKITRDLPFDPFDKTKTRRKRFSSFIIPGFGGVIFPSGRTIDKDGKRQCTYHQTSHYNGEIKATVKGRTYLALPDEIENSEAFKNLLLQCRRRAVEAGIVEDHDDLYCNVHVVEQRATAKKRCAVTPSTFHVDGEKITFICLLHRDSNTQSGESYVGARTLEVVGKTPQQITDETKILLKTVLRVPFDTVVVNDELVSHHANSIGTSDQNDAVRQTMLIDFTPCRRELSTPLTDKNA